jgi:hypothetical protein
MRLKKGMSDLSLVGVSAPPLQVQSCDVHALHSAIQALRIATQAEILCIGQLSEAHTARRSLLQRSRRTARYKIKI